MLARGLVIDSQTNEPLSRANVVITDANGVVVEPVKETTADDDGVFGIDVLPADFLTLSYVGYRNKTIAIKDFSSDIKTIKMTYLRSQDGNSGYFKERDTDNDGALTNRPISMWYWLAFGLISYYVYKQLKK